MSYEGYYQLICENGHYYTRDAYESDDCPCGAKAAWANSVDQTNCDSFGEIPLDLLKQKLLVKEAEYKTCSCCKNSELVSQAIFRIPDIKETVPLRHWRPKFGDSPLVLID